MNKLNLRESLELLFQRYHKLEYLYPDPLWVIKKLGSSYQEPWALYASLLSLGRVHQIIKVIEDSIDQLGEDFFQSNRSSSLSLKYRFFDSDDLNSLANTIKAIHQEHGSLYSAAKKEVDSNEAYDLGINLARLLREKTRFKASNLVPMPNGTGANKRLMMFLRWMVRNDDIDLGLWHSVDAASLYFPLDTHILKNSQAWGITRRKQADLKTSAEITSFFREIRPNDPVAFDFVVSRIGIHPELKNLHIDSIKK